jgi:hypothetical protein
MQHAGETSYTGARHVPVSARHCMARAVHRWLKPRQPEPWMRLASSNPESRRVDSRAALLKVDDGDSPTPT